MKLSGKYLLQYQLNNKKTQLFIEVVLKQITDDYRPRMNIWKPHVKMNGESVEYPNTENWVDAYHLAQEIGLMEKRKLKEKHKRKMKILKEVHK